MISLQQYEEWKNNLPDTEWIKDLVPAVDVSKFRDGLIKAGDQIKGKANEIDLDPALKNVASLRTVKRKKPHLPCFTSFFQWFEKRLENAIEATDKEHPRAIKNESTTKAKAKDPGPEPSGDPNGASKKIQTKAMS